MTYEFKEDSDGEYVVEQTSVLTGLRRFSVDNKVKYRGRLAAPYVSEPGNMIVRFTLNPLTASFVIMDTDYTNYALVCTCQGKKFLFDVLTFHRRSCTILQRSPERDTAISRKVIKKNSSTHYSKSQIFVQKFNFDKTPTFSRVFLPKFFLTIFLVKSKLSTAKKSKTTTFSRVFTKKNRQFSREIKVEFLDKK